MTSIQATSPPILLEYEQWRVVEMLLTLDKAKWLWQQMQRYPTLFSDATRGDVENFYNLITIFDSYWIEVLDQEDECVGIIYWTGLAKITNADVHLMFFDRRPAEKVGLCREIAKWFFIKNPQVNRMTATLPVIYHATIRLARKVGFRYIRKRLESQTIGGRAVDELVLILRAREVL